MACTGKRDVVLLGSIPAPLTTAAGGVRAQLSESMSVLIRDRLNVPQRIVLVVAFGAALRVIGWWALEEQRAADGWTSYAPTSTPLLSGSAPRFSPLVVTFGYLVLLTLWAAGSVWIFGSSAGPEERPSARPDR